MTRFLKGFGKALLAPFSGARLVGLALLIGFLGLRIADPPILEAFRLRIFDFYQRAQPREPVPLPIQVRIVDIDEKSIAEIGQWPWSRDVMATIVAGIRQRAGVGLGFDVVFAEPDRASPRNFVQALASVDPEAGAALGQLPDNDELFAAQLRQMATVVGQTGTNTVLEGVSDGAAQTTPLAIIGPDPKPYLVTFPALLKNIPVIDQAAAGRALFSVRPEIDGIVRRVPLIMRIGDTIQPTLTVELLRIVTGGNAMAVKTDEAGVKSVVVGGVEVPTDRHGRLWVNYTRHDPERYVSAGALYDGSAPAERLANTLVLVGTSAIGLLDIKATPVEPAMPGVEVHAQLLETILGRTWLERPNYALGAELVTTALLGIVVIALVPVLGAMPVLGLGALMAAVIGGGTWYLFTEQRMVFDAAYPLGTGFAVFIALVFLNYRREEVERRQIRGAFGQYLAPALVEQLAKEPDRLTLGGETRELTILFSDVRGFTTISESYKDNPQGLTALMNRFLTPLTNTIIERDGTIDKYMGDAIMAFWNAPLDVPGHPERALEAALAMMDEIAAVNSVRQAEADAAGEPFLPLNVGVGLNTGECVVGNMGSDMRFDYSVLGDSVNLASRLEGQSKTYGIDIVVGDRTAALAGDRFALAEIDLIRVKGKQEPERIFGLFGDGAVAEDAAFVAFKAANQALLSAYRSQDWPSARAALDSARAARLPVSTKTYLGLYEARINDYETTPPGPDWDGVFVATTK